jgi:hypothetical protein
MKKFRFIVLIAAAVALLAWFGVPMLQEQMSLAGEPHIKALLVYQPHYRDMAPQVLNAYQSVLEEEGIPFKTVDVFHLIVSPAAPMVRTAPAVILPDGILQSAPSELKKWIREYLEAGGNVAVIYDAGTRNPKGTYLSQALFADFTGINYITFAESRDRAYGLGTVSFVSPSHRDKFQFPLGKTLDGLILSGYGYGKLFYPLARTSLLRPIDADDVYAYGLDRDGERYPVIVSTRYGAGKVLYVNLPLGHLKANSDDLPLRAVLRTFLFDIIAMPHLMNVEGGKGGLVINWHIDYNGELTNLPVMIKQGYLREDLQRSLHITAGEFNDAPNDGSGFDACGQGKSLTLTLRKYGRIGSHGGWAHNWFAKNIEEGRFGEKEITEYIKKNNDCLKSITGYAIDEYSAPVGVHPQPMTTKILERLGVVAYYSTGDTGSAPNRAFIDGKMISEKVIAFPVMPLGKTASFYEMDVIDRKTPAQVRQWFHNILSYIAGNRTVRLVYSHPYNIKHYPAEIRDFLDTAGKMKAKNQLQVKPMGEFARFSLRFLKTISVFRPEGGNLNVTLKNPEGLAGITAAIPKKLYGPPAENNLAITEDETYFYVTIKDNETERSFLCARR